MTDTPPSIDSRVSDTLAEAADISILPQPIRSEVTSILSETTISNTDAISNPPTPGEILAIALLVKRGSESDIHREAKNLGEHIADASMKTVLASVYAIDDSSVDVPSRSRSVAEFVDALCIAGGTISVKIKDDTPISDWCDQTGLTESDTAERTVARQAALTVVLRSLAFEQSNTVDIERVSQSTYTEAIETAHAELEDASPEWFALDAVADGFSPVVFDWLVELRHHVTPVENPSEFLAQCYERLVAQEDRWRLGEFRTPLELATLTAKLGMEDPTDIVLSPGIGAGTITAETARSKSETGRETPLSDIHAVDVSPLRVLLGNAALQASDESGEPVFYATDFFGIAPDDLPQIDAVISNPPYTKHHELTTREKTLLNEQAMRTTNRSISKLSPLYTYFTIHATQFLDDGDTGVFLTPAEILNTEYGTEWKEFIADLYDIDAFILFKQANGSKFDDVATTSLITVGTRNRTRTVDDTTTFIRVDEQPGDETLVSAVRDAGGDPDRVETEWGFINTVSNDDLNPAENWSVFFDSYEPVIDDQLVPFEDLAEINRGISTGQNSFFCLNEDDREGTGNGQSWDIPSEFLSPIVRKAHQVPHYDYRREDWSDQRDDGTAVWLLYHTRTLDWDSTYFEQDIADEKTAQQRLNAFTPEDCAPAVDMEAGLSPGERNVVEYLKYGMQLDDPPHQTHVARHRDTWYVVDERQPADILYTSMTRNRGRFIYNRMGARNLNNVHSIYLTEELSPTETKALLAYLNSGFADRLIKRSGRTLSSGMSKVEPGDLTTIPVIDPREVDADIIESLAELFDDLCQASRTGAPPEADVREEIHETLRSFLRL